MRQIILLPLLFLSALLSAADDELFLKLGGGVGRYVGQKDNYLEMGAFYATDDVEDWVPLVDASVYYLENRTWAASFGVGVRTNPCDCERSYGANIYYDCRRYRTREYLNCHRCDTDHHFLNRIGIGFETLGECFDLRINGYLPVGKSHIKGTKRTFTEIGDGYEASYRKHEYLPYGVDGEIGYRTDSFCDFSLYGAVGGYYYFKREIEKMAGPQARLALLYSDLAEVEAIYTYDKVNHSCVQGRIMFTIPLDTLCNCMDCVEHCFNYLKQPIKRNGIIFTEGRCCWNYNW